jgi:hypothetical protein
MDEGQIVVDSISPMSIADVTDDLARESGFSDVKNLLQTAKHGSGDNVYLIRFHYLPPGAWDVARSTSVADEDRKPTLLQRIRSSTPTALPKKGKGGLTTRRSRGRRE